MKDGRWTARAAALALCMLAAGCGADGGGGSPASPGPTRAGPPDCAAAGIDADGGREGTCQVGGVVRTVADRQHALVIDDDVRVRLSGVQTHAARGDRRLIAVELRVTNLGRDAVRWPTAPGQVALYLRDRLIPQTPRSRAAAARASRRPPAARLAPAADGTVVAGWLLGAEDARALRARGSAVILVPPFEAQVGVTSVGLAERIGVLRLWK